MGLTLLCNWIFPLPNRYVQEFNIALILTAAYGISATGRWRNFIVIAVVIVGIIAGRDFLRHAWEAQPRGIDPETLIAKQISGQLAGIAGSSRVLVAGELEGSLNIWTNIRPASFD